ncbi:MAG: hypothetical protein HY721_33595 [Planctomycetes bacterium]|nr:hypothetical protein [Planctomycetota bacterium]
MRLRWPSLHHSPGAVARALALSAALTAALATALLLSRRSPPVPARSAEEPSSPRTCRETVPALTPEVPPPPPPAASNAERLARVLAAPGEAYLLDAVRASGDPEKASLLLQAVLEAPEATRLRAATAFLEVASANDLLAAFANPEARPWVLRVLRWRGTLGHLPALARFREDVSGDPELQRLLDVARTQILARLHLPQRAGRKP